MGSVVIVIGVLVGVWTIAGYLPTHSIEEPAYEIEKKASGYEIRRYKPQLRAEVTVKGEFKDSLNEGFRKIADFIFGNNTTRADIAMTAPVIAETSTKIAMTAPVIHHSETKGNVHTVAFVMPSQYTLETLPRPNNPEVQIRPIGQQRVAALSFRGYVSEKRAMKMISKLQTALEKDGIKTTGSAQVAQYNPPWTPPYIRRNEILIPLE